MTMKNLVVGGLAVVACCLAAGAADDPAQVIYRSFNKELKMTAKFAEMGVSLRCFFAANTLNASGNPYCEYGPIWLGEGRYDWSQLDAQVADLTNASPKAEFICMVDLNTPPWLTRRFAMDSFSDISHAASDPAWLRLTERWMVDFLTEAERRHGSRIRGYLLSGGGTSEWYEYDRGRSSGVKNAAWRRWCAAKGVAYGEVPPCAETLSRAAFENVLYDPATEAEKIDWWRFHNGVIADAILRFAKTARTVVPRKKPLGVFFGYVHVGETATSLRAVSFGHLDCERVFASPDIDFIVAPGNYSNRAIGGCSGSQLMPLSVRLHGKRFLHEIDFKPHSFSASGYWKTPADDLAGNTREAAFAIVNHAHMWWFDMWGHFYDDPALRERIAKLKTISDRFASDACRSAAEVLLVSDPQSLVGVNEKDEKSRRFSQRLRNRFGQTGVPFDTCLFNDLAALDLSQYRVVCLQSTTMIDEARAKFLRERVLRDGRTVLWCYAPGVSDGKTLDPERVRTWSGVAFGTPGVRTTEMGAWRSVYACDDELYTAEVLRDLFVRAGATAVADLGNPVFANERLFAVHSSKGGRLTIRLPRPAKSVTELLSGREIRVERGSFDFDFETPDTRLFEIPGEDE